MAYPIYEQRTQRNYPDPKSVMIDWAGAGEKIMRGITEGVELGLKIKDSRQNALLTAARIRQSDEAVAASQIETGLHQRTTDAALALDHLQTQRLQAEFQRNFSAAAVQNDALTQALTLQQTQRETQANAALTQNDAMFNDVQANAINIKLAMETTNDPSIRQQNLDLLKEDWNNLQEAIGMEPTKLAMSLRKDDPRAQQLAMLNPILTQKQYLLDMMVPIRSSVLTQTEYDTSEPYAAGKQSSDKTTTSITMVPLSVARSHWQAGQSLETFTGLRDNAADPASFDKWAKESGLGKLIATPAPAPAATSAPIAPLTPQETANPIITEKANDLVHSMASNSPLEKETGSLWQKLRGSISGKTAAVLGLSIPGSTLAIAPIIRSEAEGVKWIADKTGFGIPQATALRDKIREWLPKAEDAQNQFNADPAKVDANNQYWNDQKASLTKEMQTAAPQRQKIIQKALDLMAPVATPDSGTTGVAANIQRGIPGTPAELDKKINYLVLQLKTDLPADKKKIVQDTLAKFTQQRAQIAGR
jgi:hypothetical protein